MARIRTIKPEFWDSPDTARASHRGRLFFIALWNWADDYGVGTANGKALVGFAFPNDDSITAKDFPTLRKEVAEAFGVVFYEVDGRPYYSIPSWDKHQRTERKAKRMNPAPPEGISAGQSNNHGATASSQGTSDAMHGSSGVGTGEQGNRGKGTGEEEHTSIAPRSTTSKNSDAYSEAFEAFWSAYPRKTAKGAAAKAFDKARLRTGSAQNLIDAVQRFAADPNLPAAEFVPHAATWLNESRYNDGALPPRSDGRRRNADDAARDILAMADRIGREPHLKAING